MKFYAGCLLHYNTFQGLKKSCPVVWDKKKIFLLGKYTHLHYQGRFQAINPLNKSLSNKDGPELVMGKQNDWAASKRQAGVIQF